MKKAAAILRQLFHSQWHPFHFHLSLFSHNHSSIRMVFFSGNFASIFFGMLSFRTPCSNLAFTSSHPRLPTNSVPLSDSSQCRRHRNMRILPLFSEKSAFSSSERTVVFPACHFAIFRWKQPCIGFKICRKSSGIGIPDR